MIFATSASADVLTIELNDGNFESVDRPDGESDNLANWANSTQVKTLDITGQSGYNDAIGNIGDQAAMNWQNGGNNSDQWFFQNL